MSHDEKLARLTAALTHREGDRVPVSDAFWSGFVLRGRAKWGPEFDPYRFFDLDYIIVTPNMDPRIQPFEVLRETGDEIVVKTGFGATIRRSGVLPMPSYEAFEVQTPEQMATCTFDNPADPRRFYSGGDDQINGVGDSLVRDIPPWDERVDAYAADIPIMGSVCEPYEYLWRVVGSRNALFWMAAERERLQAFVDRIGAFQLAFAVAQIDASRGRLSGMYIWGDVAYRNGMFFSPQWWREMFKPHVRDLIDLFHQNDLLTIYHGCGNASPIFDDLVEIGLDGYNPVEAKADLDVVELKERYAGTLAFVGNIDVRVLERGDPVEIESEVRRKLASAVGGGWVCQSDHSVSSDVAPESYALMLETLRKYGTYPLSM